MTVIMDTGIATKCIYGNHENLKATERERSAFLSIRQQRMHIRQLDRVRGMITADSRIQPENSWRRSLHH